MIHIEEIRDEYNTKGTFPIITVSAVEKFVEWQKAQKKARKNITSETMKRIIPIRSPL